MVSKEVFEQHLENMGHPFDNDKFFEENFDKVLEGNSNGPAKKSRTYQDRINDTVEINISLDDLSRMSYYTEGKAFLIEHGPFEFGIIPLELAEKSLGKELVQKYIDSDECKKYHAISFSREEPTYPGIFNPLFNY